MKMGIALLALVGTFVGGVGMAEADQVKIDGNYLLKSCQSVVKVSDGGELPSKQAVEFGYCSGLLEGARTTMWLNKNQLNPPYRICFPDDISNEQSARIVVKYLENHPEELNQNPTALALYAFKTAYPCKK
jgi:hypothetical protein